MKDVVLDTLRYLISGLQIMEGGVFISQNIRAELKKFSINYTLRLSYQLR